MTEPEKPFVTRTDPVSLREVTAKTVRQITSLDVAENQKQFVARLEL